ncbi:hypothetical protein [Massilia sp. TS11]|uniref:hypothetical protein n=1 Tax=Massilia sp. TS11 TaxID=2908003 RepID=UPI001EDB8017|nr:hypothetical protein [Massilia sp. TS11]MCG2586549.1 hypothetical protein [Massilia sp. TS11]
MANSKKPRKAYRPRPVSVNAAEWAVAGACCFTASMVADLIEPVRAAYDKLRQGQATVDDWNTLVQALNLGEALAVARIGAELMPFLHAGMAALQAVAERRAAGRSSVCTGAELTTIYDAMSWYRSQLRICTQAEYSRAIKSVKNWHMGGGSRRVAELIEKMAA